MRWIIGVDLAGRCRGALSFCEWIAANSRAADEERFELVHVLEDREVRPFQPHVSLSEIERLAREAMDQAIEGSPVATRRAHMQLELLHETTADRALTRRVTDAADTILLIGRKAARNGTGWVRLGRIARRLTRALPAPVIVVPSDLDASTIGDGPIMLATSLREDSDGAAELAKQLAARFDRRLFIAHVVPGIADDPPHFVPAATRHQLLAQLRLEGERDVEVWRRRHALTRADVAVAAGDVVERLQGIAREENAAMLIVGSRRLSLGARLYTSSVGTDLAGAAPCAVAVVPPPG